MSYVFQHLVPVVFHVKHSEQILSYIINLKVLNVSSLDR